MARLSRRGLFRGLFAGFVLPALPRPPVAEGATLPHVLTELRRQMAADARAAEASAALSKAAIAAEKAELVAQATLMAHLSGEPHA